MKEIELLYSNIKIGGVLFASKQLLCRIKHKDGFKNVIKLTDEKYIKYLLLKGINVINPVTYADKLHWLNLYDHNEQYSVMVDKYLAKEYVASKIGKEYIIPLYGKWDSFDEIDFNQLPDQFVLKTNHDSASTVICTDKRYFNFEDARSRLSTSLSSNYYDKTREWVYKNVKPCIIAEQYMVDGEDQELRDYKFLTFGGEPKLLYIAQGRKSGETYADFFDMNYKHMEMVCDHEMAPTPPHRPKNFELMKSFAQILSKGIPQLRVDFYEVNGKVYFGELTFFHCGGYAIFSPEKWNNILGSWITLPKNQNGRKVTGTVKKTKEENRWL